MKNKKIYIPLLILILVLSAYFVLFPKEIRPTNLNPQKDGLIYDKETAVKIAEAVWLPIYGSEIYKHRPFIATQQDSF